MRRPRSALLSGERLLSGRLLRGRVVRGERRDVPDLHGRQRRHLHERELLDVRRGDPGVLRWKPVHSLGHRV
jgi:hypothetical protein